MTSPLLLSGLGNVLLDLVLPVTDEEFEALNLPVPRGQVLRVTPCEQSALLRRFPPERVTRNPGGSCANALRAFAWHGMPAKLLGLAGDDQAAEFLIQAFQAAKVDTTGIKRLPGHATDCCLALVTPDGERTMLPAFDAGGTASENSFQITDLKLVNSLHIEGYCLRFPAMLEAVLSLARTCRLQLSWDLGDVSLVQAHHTELERIFRAHPLACLFSNHSEAQAFTGSPTASEAAVALNAFAACAVVTAGADGAWIAAGDMDAIHVPAVPPAVLVDTIGAGDSFEGAFLAAYYSGATPAEAARQAAGFAAQVIALPGATMPKRG
ncbi:MAG: adenosine kinase [Victivallales bacterium]|nr:adenosine kinase [Victivallales bacterium]